MKRFMHLSITMIVTLSLLLSGVLGAITEVHAANPAPVQIFYVTLPEGDGLTVLNSITGAAVTPMYTYFSISIALNGTLVYYDQWEDGYAGDIANPSPSEIYNSVSKLDGVQIWGNGLAADGCAPDKSGVPVICTDGNDVLNAGDVVIPYNSVPVPLPANAVLFDGKDKVGASKSIAMTRATWASGSGTLNAFAHEMYATAEWGTLYKAPVGTNTANAGQMFEYSGLSIMASQNNTTVQIDADANGSYEISVILGEGGSYLISGIIEGAAVLADKPVQVLLATGDIGSTYASRDMNLLPVSFWGSSYWSPVGTVYNTNNTRLFLFNPGPNSIYITCEKYLAANTTLGPVAAGTTVNTDLTTGQGAHCFASLANGTATADKISAVGTIDSTGTAYDWSFTLYPDNYLTTEGLVGLGLGRDPTYSQTQYQNENGNPIWVTTTCAGGTYVYVDWNNDGNADQVDTDGDGVANAGTQNGILVNRMQSQRLFEPPADPEPYDQTGARVWSRTASGVGLGGTPGCTLALAWGQDPDHATAGTPGLDVGTSIPPLRLVEGTKNLEIAIDTPPLGGILNPGDTVYYNIIVNNIGSVPVLNVRVYDNAPVNTTYVANTTYWSTDNVSWTKIPVGDDGGVLPVSVAGGYLLGTLPVGGTFYVRFQVTLDPGDYEEIENCQTTFTDAGTFGNCVLTPVATRDWGDLPDSFGTSAAAFGPNHSPSGLILGTLWDSEVQGVPTINADGDDVATSDDEDGVINSATTNQWGQGAGAFQVTVNGGPGCLNAWMDFTNDAGVTAGEAPIADLNFTKISGGYDSFTDISGTYSEHIIQNLLVVDGTFTVPVSVPSLAYAQQQFYLRFRLSPTDGEGACTVPIAPTGFIDGGEVEDYLIEFGEPTAVTMLDFGASVDADVVSVTWETVNEVDNVGFNLYRLEGYDGQWFKVNGQIIPTNSEPGSLTGATYEYSDTNFEPGQVYYYLLEAIDMYGVSSLEGLVLVHVSAK